MSDHACSPCNCTCGRSREPRVLLVGEVNPYGMDPRYALFHEPRHASGNRLREILGLTDVAYMKLTKINLCTGRWSMREARAMVRHIRATPQDYARRTHAVVMLGAKVKAAFDLPDLKFFEVHRACPSLISLPHPSGLNRLWNEPGARERARTIMRALVPEVPWGSSG